MIGLIASLYLFPTPTGPMDYLLESFLVAAFIPAIICLILERTTKKTYNFDELKEIKGLDQQVSK